ncbi:MAG: FAD-dependent thymidylate synthase [Caldimicrobium sp.]
MTLEELRNKQKTLISLVLKNMESSFLPIYLPFSYLGARICYAETHPLLLFEEEKFKDLERFKSFLLHLKKAGHFSVFAHTPIFVKLHKLSLKEKFELSSTYFKVFIDEDLALFNLRHLAENLSDQEFLNLINLEPRLDKVEVTIFRKGQKIFSGTLNNIDPLLIKEEKKLWAEPEIIILRSIDPKPFSWIGVIAHNFSRLFSHQFVRHTWLNFNQRSHRYTKVDKFVIPKAFKEKDVKVYQEIIEKSLKIYEELSLNMKRESARFVVPQGVATTVFATGPLFVWQDFIEKRIIPQAQDEIRELAKILKEVLLLVR